MSRYSGEADYQHDEMAATGVLVTNMGTPKVPTTPALRKYLKQFLSDPRVIENQGWKWKLILHGIILRSRPARSAHAYAQVWTKDGSPLLAIVNRQASGIETTLRKNIGSPIHVAIGMGYGQPSVREGLAELRSKHCRRILIMPLFPQYASATIGSTFDAVADVLKTWRWVPDLRMVTHYHDHPGYITGLASSVREFWKTDGEPERLLISFHGLPKDAFLAGDPYFCHCQKTGRLLVNALELPAARWLLSFQSRFGKAVWLRPYTDATLKEWGKAGVKSVDVVCPGFSADCLETIQEIGLENQRHFLEAGGVRYRYIPALNDRPDHIAALSDIIERNLQGWITPMAAWDEAAMKAEAQRSKKLADLIQAEGLNV